MSAWEFTYWQAYANLNPFGCFWDDYKDGLLLSLLANIHAGENEEPADPNTFFPHLEIERDEDPASIRAALKEWVLASGGKVVDPAGNTLEQRPQLAPKTLDQKP